MVDSRSRVAVVGAGIAGLSAARTLADHGLEVTVFDKGRGVGGRMSTRRAETSFRFDHGAQYFSTRDERFRRHVDRWQQAGVVERWEGRVGELVDGKLTRRESTDRFVGIPGMSAVCKHLAHGIAVESGVVVASLENRGRWWLLADDRTVGEFEQLVIAIPPAQAASVLRNVSPLADRIARVRMAPRWAAMLAFPQRIPFDADGAFVRNSPISWLSRDSSKPGRSRDTDCWVVHASAEWSAANLEDTADETVSRLVPEFFRVIGSDPQEPRHASAHRWRYAIPMEPLEAGYLMDTEANIAVCGDWCLGNRVEAAFLSGVCAAEALLRTVSQQVPVLDSARSVNNSSDGSAHR